MSEPGGPRLLERVRRHERTLALTWLGLVALAGLVVAVAPLRARLLDGAQAAMHWWDSRWTERLEEAERLVEAGRWEEATAYLERLDRSHPARIVRHGRDKERERVLALLAQSYEALDRRTRALETYQRLVDFDPRHYRNYVALAEASDRLRSRATMAVEARDAYAAALAIFPAHLQSTRGVIQYHLDRGEFAPVVAAYERYLDAFLVQHVHLEIGGAAVELPVMVDGRARDYDIAVSTDLEAGSALTVATGGYAVAVERVEVLGALRVGEPGPGAVWTLNPDDAERIDLEAAGRGAYRGRSRDAALRWPVGSRGPARGIRLRLALFKPVDDDLWNAVSKSYANLLDDRRQAAAAARTVTLPTADAADAVLATQIWAIEGLLPGSDGSED